MSHCSRSSSSEATSGGIPDADISSLMEMLESVPDPRGKRGRRHSLVFILAVSVIAMLAGASTFRQIGTHAEMIPQTLLAKLGSRWSWFKNRFEYPDKSTIRRVFEGIDAARFDSLVGSWLSTQVHRDGSGLQALAVDGKVQRGSWTDGNDQVTLLSAMLHDSAVTIAQVRVPDGTNEITQVEALFENIPTPEDETVLVTIDAVHTQVETAEFIDARKGFEYVMTVKGNQPTLQKSVFDKCVDLTRKPPHDLIEENARGGIRRWSAWFTDADGIDFPGAERVGLIRRDLLEATGRRIRKEIALIITSGSADQIDAATLNARVRGHWGIENKSHYLRDTVWKEDANQTYSGSGPQALATIRNLAIGLFRLKDVKSIKEETERVHCDRMLALQYMVTRSTQTST